MENFNIYNKPTFHYIKPEKIIKHYHFLKEESVGYSCGVEIPESATHVYVECIDGDEVLVSFQKEQEVENKNYEKQLKEYEKQLSIYKKALKEYNVGLKNYKEEQKLIQEEKELELYKKLKEKFEK